MFILKFILDVICYSWFTLTMAWRKKILRPEFDSHLPNSSLIRMRYYVDNDLITKDVQLVFDSYLAVIDSFKKKEVSKWELNEEINKVKFVLIPLVNISFERKNRLLITNLASKPKPSFLYFKWTRELIQAVDKHQFRSVKKQQVELEAT